MKTLRIYILIFIFIFINILYNCKKNVSVPNPNQPPTTTIANILSGSSELSVGGRTFGTALDAHSGVATQIYVELNPGVQTNEYA